MKGKVGIVIVRLRFLELFNDHVLLRNTPQSKVPFCTLFVHEGRN
jgi:hypothetical protein